MVVEAHFKTIFQNLKLHQTHCDFKFTLYNPLEVYDHFEFIMANLIHLPGGLQIVIDRYKVSVSAETTGTSQVSVSAKNPDIFL